jgi:3-methyladenine DNA glycosylase AlkD
MPGFFMTEVDEIIELLKEKSNPAHLAGMKRFGIQNDRALGIPLPELRKIAKAIKINQELSLALWKTNFHEARILASMIGDPAKVTPEQFDVWAGGFNSWDVCDQVCGNLFDRVPFAIEKAFACSLSQQEFIKRAGFVLMAEYAVHQKKAPDEVFIAFFPVMEREACDNRNFVKKAVNWALRQIGKRNENLRRKAIECAERMLTNDCKSARWIASDAIRELSRKGPATNN